MTHAWLSMSVELQCVWTHTGPDLSIPKGVTNPFEWSSQICFIHRMHVMGPSGPLGGLGSHGPLGECLLEASQTSTTTLLYLSTSHQINICIGVTGGILFLHRVINILFLHVITTLIGMTTTLIDQQWRSADGKILDQCPLSRLCSSILDGHGDICALSWGHLI